MTIPSICNIESDNYQLTRMHKLGLTPEEEAKHKANLVEEYRRVIIGYATQTQQDRRTVLQSELDALNSMSAAELAKLPARISTVV